MLHLNLREVSSEMKKIFIIRNLEGYGHASTQTLKDGLRFSSEIGFAPIKLETLPKFITRLFLNHFNMECVLAIYPYIYSPLKTSRRRTLNCFRLTNFVRKKFFILYVVDLPIHQNIAFDDLKVVDKKAYRLEKKIFESASVICVFNKLMKETIQEYAHVPDEKFIEFGILDYGVKIPRPKKIKLEVPVKIVYAGNLEKRFMYSSASALPPAKGINYKFFGLDGDWINALERQDMEYCGALQPEELLSHISTNAHFGLIGRDLNNTHQTHYHNLGTTSKFSAYMVAGLPILAPSSYSYISYLTKKYKIGYSFDLLQELPEIVSEVNSDEYGKIRENCLKLGDKIKEGYFFKRAINIALKNY